jgi:DNA-binding transcriptional MerR regulator
MRIGELSRRAGVPVPTIKFYLREGLLPPGEPAGRNQASYGEAHLHRLRLVQALRGVGGLTVAATREVVRTLDGPLPSRHELMGRAHRAVIRPSPHDPADPDWTRAREEAAGQVRDLGWRVDPGSPALDRLADVLLAAHRVGGHGLVKDLPDYAEAALAVARREVASAVGAGDPAAVMAAVVTGTVLGEALLSAVRLLAHEHVSADGVDHGVCA